MTVCRWHLHVSKWLCLCCSVNCVGIGLAQTSWKSSLHWVITQAELQLISKLFLTSLQSLFHCQNPGAYYWIFLLFINKNRFPDHNTFSSNYEHVSPLAHAYLWQKPRHTLHEVWRLCILWHLGSTKTYFSTVYSSFFPKQPGQRTGPLPNNLPAFQRDTSCIFLEPWLVLSTRVISIAV